MLSNHLILCHHLLLLPSIFPSIRVFICSRQMAKGWELQLQHQSFQWMWKCKSPVVSDSLWPHRLYNPWNSPGQNTGVSSHFLLQGIFSTQESTPGLLHWRQILYQMSHQGRPSNEYSVLIFFRIYWFDLLTVQGTLKSHPQHHNLKASILQHSAFFMVQPSHLYMTTGKTIDLTRKGKNHRTLSSKWCLFFLTCFLGMTNIQMHKIRLLSFRSQRHVNE